MGTHAYHDTLEGYHPSQLLHDGCGECEYRGENLMAALGHLDRTSFLRAWERAAAWNGVGTLTGPISVAEAPMLRALYAVQVQLERFGVAVGTLPVGAR